MGWTTVNEAAVPMLSAKHTHEELRDTPIVDKACCLLMANNEIVLDLLEAGELERARHVVAWHDLGGQGLRRQGGQPRRRRRLEVGQGRQDALRADRRLQQGDRRARSSRPSPASWTTCGLPHPLHLHCNNLGNPGNFTTTLETMKILEGNRAHIAHLQFHAYGGDDWHSIRSEAAAVAEYFNAHPHLTADAGAILFGDTVTITADGPWQHLLYQLTGRKWGNLDVENETGCGIVPYTYRPSNLVNAVQWAVGLELLLLINDPWRIFLTTDHPNGACFWRYPEIIHLLMNADFRREQLKTLPPKALKRIVLADLDREYTPVRDRHHHLGRAGAALGLSHKGHLGVGADADVTIYNDTPDVARMFGYPRYVLKGGEIVLEEGEIRRTPQGREFLVQPAYDEHIEEYLRPVFQQVYTMSFDNYPVEMERVSQPEIHACQEAVATAMSTITLTLKEQPTVPLEAESLSPDVVAGLGHDAIRALPVFLGKTKCRVDDFFEVSGADGDELEIHGDARLVKWIGRGMTRGRITIHGNAGMHLGAHMKGGAIAVSGNATDWVGGEMTGGLIRIHGNAGGQVGAAYRGSLAGMKGGTILIGGSAGLEVGMRMRRGIIAVGGPVRDFAGLQMKGGSIFLLSGAEIRTGAWMVRGTIVSLKAIRLLPTFSYACAYNPSFLHLYARRLRELGVAIPHEAQDGAYQRFTGDASVPGKGEILVWRPHAS